MAGYVKQQKEFFYQYCFIHVKIRQTPTTLVPDTRWVEFKGTKTMVVGENYNSTKDETYFIEEYECPECKEK